MQKFPTEKSLSNSTKSCNLYFASTTKSGDRNKNNNIQYQEAIKKYKNLCKKSFTNPQQTFIITLKGEILNLFIDNFRLKDVQIINKIVGAFFYFKHIYLSPFDTRGK